MQRQATFGLFALRLWFGRRIRIRRSWSKHVFSIQTNHRFLCSNLIFFWISERKPLRLAPETEIDKALLGFPRSVVCFVAGFVELKLCA